MRRSLASINPCGLTRVLLPAMFVAVVVSTLAANDALGWLAAAITVGALLVVQRVRGTAATCAISPPPIDRSSDVPTAAPEEPAEAVR